MTIRRSPDIWCDSEDGCGEWADVDTDWSGRDDARSLRRAAKRIGWSYVDGKDYCPKHLRGEGQTQ